MYEELEAYNAFQKNFDIGNQTDNIAQVLEKNAEMKALFEEVVPTELSYEVFWTRYFFREEADELYAQEQLHRQQQLELEKAQRKQEAVSKVGHDECTTLDDELQQWKQKVLSLESMNEAMELKHLRDVEHIMTQMSQLQQDGENGQKAAYDEGMEQGLKVGEVEKQSQSDASILMALVAYANAHEQSLAGFQYQQYPESIQPPVIELVSIFEAKSSTTNVPGHNIELSRAPQDQLEHEHQPVIADLAKQVQHWKTQAQDLSNTNAQQYQEMEAQLKDKTHSIATLQQKLVALEQETTHALQQSAEQLEQQRGEMDALNDKVQELTNLQATTSSISPAVEELEKELKLWKARAIKMKKSKEEVEQKIKDMTNEG